MNIANRVVNFYMEGFRSMTLGRTLWLIIIVKLFIMFAVLKVFFFRDPYAGHDKEQRQELILDALTPENTTTNTKN